MKKCRNIPKSVEIYQKEDTLETLCRSQSGRLFYFKIKVTMNIPNITLPRPFLPKDIPLIRPDFGYTETVKYYLIIPLM